MRSAHRFSWKASPVTGPSQASRPPQPDPPAWRHFSGIPVDRIFSNPWASPSRSKFPGISFLAFRWVKVYTHLNPTISVRKGRFDSYPPFKQVDRRGSQKSALKSEVTV